MNEVVALPAKDAILLVLDQVDFTHGACGPFEMVGAVLPEQVLVLAKASVLSAPDGPQKVALQSLIGVLDYTQHCCRPTALVGAALDTSIIENARDVCQERSIT